MVIGDLSLYSKRSPSSCPAAAAGRGVGGGGGGGAAPAATPRGARLKPSPAAEPKELPLPSPPPPPTLRLLTTPGDISAIELEVSSAPTCAVTVMLCVPPCTSVD